VTSKIKDGIIQNPENSLFAPVKVEAHLKKIGDLVNKVNLETGRTTKPIRLSIDEWNNRHSVFNGTEYEFTRKDPRSQFDVAVTAQMLNVFIRQSPMVGMANYIFPVNGHGLIKTVEDTGAYVTPIYFVFKQYQSWMNGNKLDLELTGSGIRASTVQTTLDGDSKEVILGDEFLPFIDAAAVVTKKGEIHISLINRSHENTQRVEVQVPEGFNGQEIWILDHENIHATNSSDNRDEVIPRTRVIKTENKKIVTDIPPCGLHMIKLTSNP